MMPDQKFKPTTFTLWKSENDPVEDLFRFTHPNELWPFRLGWEKIGDIKVYSESINQTMIDHLADGEGCAKITRIALKYMEQDKNIIPTIGCNY